MLKRITVLTVIVLTCACQSGPRNSMPNNAENQSSLDGIWESQGYGYVLKIHGNNKKIYDISSNHCFDKGLSQRELSSILTDLKVIDAHTIQAKIESGITDYYFKRIEKLPLTCKQKYDKNHAESIRYFIDVMKTHYAYFELHGVDWEQRSNEVIPLLDDQVSDNRAYQLMLKLLSGLNDAHIYLAAEINGQERLYVPVRSTTLRPALDRAFAAQNKIKDGRTFRRAWFEEHKKTIEVQILKGQYKYAANDRILWGIIGDVGYINLLRMMDLTKSGSVQADLKAFKKNMNSIMKALKDTRSLIIDVTTNSGGHDEIGLAMAGFFTAQETHVYSKVAHGSGLPLQSVTVKPSDLYYDKPVYLLSSDHTVSAAETFVMAMKNFPQVIHVGDTTRGAFSDVLDKQLPNGWEVGFSNETYLDTLGYSWEGKGLKPQWPIPVFAGRDIYQSHAQMILALLSKVTR